MRLRLLATCCLLVDASIHADDIERDPIKYSTAVADNAITRLQSRLDAGKVKLAFDDKFGYLPGVLKELGIRTSSQTLVFSKTSFQRHRIGPGTPRAIYFNDEVYLGYCHLGEALEFTATDPKLGAVFYTLNQHDMDRPRFVRNNDNCLLCHASSQNQRMPGNLLRSVYADADGQPILSIGSSRIDHASPIKQRWGGWYVTGSSGAQVHLGNLVVRGNARPEDIDLKKTTNVGDLSPYFRTSLHLTPHSDIVALMVLEHQAEMHNRLTRANFLVRLALHDERALNKSLERSADFRSDSTYRRIKSACEPLVKYLLMSGEAALTGPIEGSTSYAKEFALAGPRDAQKRSLRDLDLQTRLFRYPCSYMIYSEAFEALPSDAKDYIYKRMWDILNGQPGCLDYEHLTPADCQAIIEIVRETKPALPACWRK